VYLTGDIARVLPDAGGGPTIEFVGREDDLVKLGGIRVELGEVSAALGGAHARAREAATVLARRPE
jgi:ferricrocin synthase